MPTHALEKRREEIVLAHMDAENRGDWDGALETFHRPCYEIIPTGEILTGAEQVGGFYDENKQAFPTMKLDLVSLQHTEEMVVVEVDFDATQDGAWRGLPPTGRRIHYRMCNLFLFEEDRLMCERMYFDLLIALRQVGIARDPTTAAGRVSAFANHPVTILRAFARGLTK